MSVIFQPSMPTSTVSAVGWEREREVGFADGKRKGGEVNEGRRWMERTLGGTVGGRRC